MEPNVKLPRHLRLWAFRCSHFCKSTKPHCVQMPRGNWDVVFVHSQSSAGNLLAIGEMGVFSARWLCFEGGVTASISAAVADGATYLGGASSNSHALLFHQ